MLPSGERQPSRPSIYPKRSDNIEGLLFIVASQKLYACKLSKICDGFGMTRAILFFFILLCSACHPNAEKAASLAPCDIELLVLGIGQDAGAPQIGIADDPAWSDSALRLMPTSLAVIDHKAKARLLFEATPAITEQLRLLDNASSWTDDGLGITGVFLTHAHIGHYAGLIYFGREAAGAKDIDVYVMPRFAEYLRQNGPWEQLVNLGNISLTELAHQAPIAPTPSVAVTPLKVPHRDEYSETVGFLIEANGRRVLFIPDIDSWDEWDKDYGVKLQALIETVDYAFLDATFYDDNELPGRDMSLIPHPRVAETMDRLQHLPDDKRAGVHFIHINHTNPIRYEDSSASKFVRARGFSIAREGQTLCLSD